MSDHPATTQAAPGLPSDILDRVATSLFAAIPASDQAGPAERRHHETTLLAELATLRPRDLEEAMLATQFLVAHHAGLRAFAEGARRKPGGRKASRLLRDAIALQRSSQATMRVLHKSQQRPMAQDAVDGVPRPTVPPAAPRPFAPTRAERAAANAEPPPPAAPPKPRKDPFEGHPDLRELSDRWETLPPWEQMTMEERRRTFGYNYTPKPAGNAAPATGA